MWPGNQLMLALVGKVKLFLKEEASCFQASILLKADIGVGFFEASKNKQKNTRAPKCFLIVYIRCTGLKTYRVPTIRNCETSSVSFGFCRIFFE